jgi:hypothetical protein
MQLHNASQYLENDGDTGGIIGPEVCSAVAVEYAVTQYWPVTKTRWHPIHMRIEQERLSGSCQHRHQVAHAINLRTEATLC